MIDDVLYWQRRFELLGQFEHSVEKGLGLGVGAVDVPLSNRIANSGVNLGRFDKRLQGIIISELIRSKPQIIVNGDGPVVLGP